MRRSPPRTYGRIRPGRAILTALICIVLAAVIIFTSLFFGLKKYIVYNDAGDLRLDIPWLAEYMHKDDKTE